MTNNNIPTGTLTRSQVNDIARALIHNWDYSNKPSPSQVRTTIDRYCDDPAINSTDKARIRAQLTLLLDD